MNRFRFFAAFALLSTLLSPLPAMSASPLDSLRRANDAIRRFRLDNGLTVLLRPEADAPLVAVQYWVRVGSVDEAPLVGAGLSHYLEHMLFQGTESRAPGAVSTEIADAGGDINAYTSLDRTVFHATVPAANWAVALDVLSDAVFHPSFPEEEWKREREVVFREVDMGRDDPGRVLNAFTWETLFRTSPYRAPVIGWKDILSTMTRDDLFAHHRRFYSPDNMILAVAGGFDPAEVEAWIRSHVAGEKRRPVPHAPVPVDPPAEREQVHRKRGPYQVSRLVYSFRTPPADSPDTPALDLLADAISAGRAAPLVKRFREDERLVHGITAWNYTPRDLGVFAVEASYDPANEEALMAGLRDFVRSLAETPLDAEWLDSARAQMLRSSLASVAGEEGAAGEMAAGEFFRGDPRAQETYLAQLAALSPEDLRVAAAEYLDTTRGTWTVLCGEGSEETASAVEPHRTEPSMVTLPGGLRLVTRADDRQPLAFVSVAVSGGQLAETPETAGAMRLLSTLLTRGTAKRSGEEIARALDSRAATLSGVSGRNTYGVSGSCFAEDLPFLLDLMGECLLESTFPESEFAKERDIQLAARKKELERPAVHARDALNRELFPGHPYALPLLGTEESLASLSPDTLRELHAARFVPQETVVAVFGDIDEAAVREAVAGKLASRMRQGGSVPPPPALPPPPAEDRTVVVDCPAQQAVVMRGWRTPWGEGRTAAEEECEAIVVDSLNGMASDLFSEVREKRGLAYYTAAAHYLGPVGGHVILYAGTQAESAGEVVSLLGEEAAKKAANGLRAEEERRAREQLASDDASLRRDGGALASASAIAELQATGFRAPYDATAIRDGVGAEDVKKMAEAIFSAPSVSVIARNPAGEAKPDAEAE